MARYPIFAPRDLDGFFGLFIDNLVQLLLIVSLCSLCGIRHDSPLLLDSILPGAALSILVGNVFYAVQAHWLARKEGRNDVTALPYGINTPSLLVYVFLVMLPAYNQSLASGASNDAAARFAWQAGLIACIGSGVIEFAGALVAGKIRAHTPRAALLSTLSGIAIGFISMTFTLQIFQRPVVAMLPLGIILLTYFAKVRFPWGIPGGLIAVLVGTACAWSLPFFLPHSIGGLPMSTADVVSAWGQRGFHWPSFYGSEIWQLAKTPDKWWGYLSVIIPMGIFNVVGSLQNIESAEAAGDRFATGPSLAVNGLGTIVAALFGSCFPTTIYIGHPGWKELGARAGYSTLNGLIITLICFTGLLALIGKLVPLEAGVPIVLWIGIIITAQAFQATQREHAPAVAVGLFPAIAAWGGTIVMGSFDKAQGRTIQELLAMEPVPAVQGLLAEVNGFLIHGMFILERGFIFTCMVLSALCASLIDRRFAAASFWSLVGAVLTFAGLTHSYQLVGNHVDFLFLGISPAETAAAYPAWGIGICYVLLAILFWGVESWLARKDNSPKRVEPAPRAKQAPTRRQP
jgi:AGZA family xanthine/uracil permease-like MFS transporter